MKKYILLCLSLLLTVSLLISAAVIAAAEPVTVSEDIVINGNFEDTTVNYNDKSVPRFSVDKWTTSSTNADFYSYDTAIFHGGKAGMKITSPASGSRSIEYRLNSGKIVVGETYTITMWLRGSTTNPTSVDFEFSVTGAGVESGWISERVSLFGAQELGGENYTEWRELKATFVYQGLQDNAIRFLLNDEQHVLENVKSLAGIDLSISNGPANRVFYVDDFQCVREVPLPEPQEPLDTTDSIILNGDFEEDVVYDGAYNGDAWTIAGKSSYEYTNRQLYSGEKSILFNLSSYVDYRFKGKNILDQKFYLEFYLKSLSSGNLQVYIDAVSQDPDNGYPSLRYYLNVAEQATQSASVDADTWMKFSAQFVIKQNQSGQYIFVVNEGQDNELIIENPKMSSFDFLQIRISRGTISQVYVDSFVMYEYYDATVNVADKNGNALENCEFTLTDSTGKELSNPVTYDNENKCYVIKDLRGEAKVTLINREDFLTETLTVTKDNRNADFGKAISFETKSLKNAVYNTLYEDSVATATGGNVVYSLKDSSVLPAGLKLEQDGKISGTPGEVVTKEFTVLASFADSDKVLEQTFTIAVGKAQQPALAITSAASHPIGSEYTLTSQGGADGIAVVYEIVDGGTGAATIENDKLTATAVGTVKIIAKKAANENYEAVQSEVFELTILKQAAPTLGKVEKVSVTQTSIEVTKLDGYEYKIGDGQWQSSNVFEGLKAGTEYEISYRFSGAETQETSEIGTIKITTAQEEKNGCNSTMSVSYLIISVIFVMTSCCIIFKQRSKGKIK